MKKCGGKINNFCSAKLLISTIKHMNGSGFIRNLDIIVKAGLKTMNAIKYSLFLATFHLVFIFLLVYNQQ